MDGKEIRGLKQEGEEGKIKKGSRKELRKGGKGNERGGSRRKIRFFFFFFFEI